MKNVLTDNRAIPERDVLGYLKTQRIISIVVPISLMLKNGAVDHALAGIATNAVRGKSAFKILDAWKQEMTPGVDRKLMALLRHLVLHLATVDPPRNAALVRFVLPMPTVEKTNSFVPYLCQSFEFHL